MQGAKIERGTVYGRDAELKPDKRAYENLLSLRPPGPDSDPWPWWRRDRRSRLTGTLIDDPRKFLHALQDCDSAILRKTMCRLEARELAPNIMPKNCLNDLCTKRQVYPIESAIESELYVGTTANANTHSTNNVISSLNAGVFKGATNSNDHNPNFNLNIETTTNNYTSARFSKSSSYYRTRPLDAPLARPSTVMRLAQSLGYLSQDDTENYLLFKDYVESCIRLQSEDGRKFLNNTAITKSMKKKGENAESSEEEERENGDLKGPGDSSTKEVNYNNRNSKTGNNNWRENHPMLRPAWRTITKFSDLLSVVSSQLCSGLVEFVFFGCYHALTVSSKRSDPEASRFLPSIFLAAYAFRAVGSFLFQFFCVIKVAILPRHSIYSEKRILMVVVCSTLLVSLLVFLVPWPNIRFPQVTVLVSSPLTAACVLIAGVSAYEAFELVDDESGLADENCQLKAGAKAVRNFYVGFIKDFLPRCLIHLCPMIVGGALWLQYLVDATDAFSASVVSSSVSAALSFVELLQVYFFRVVFQKGEKRLCRYVVPGAGSESRSEEKKKSSIDLTAAAPIRTYDVMPGGLKAVLSVHCVLENLFAAFSSLLSVLVLGSKVLYGTVLIFILHRPASAEGGGNHKVIKEDSDSSASTSTVTLNLKLCPIYRSSGVELALTDRVVSSEFYLNPVADSTPIFFDHSTKEAVSLVGFSEYAQLIVMTVLAYFGSVAVRTGWAHYWIFGSKNPPSTIFLVYQQSKFWPSYCVFAVVLITLPLGRALNRSLVTSLVGSSGSSPTVVTLSFDPQLPVGYYAHAIGSLVAQIAEDMTVAKLSAIGILPEFGRGTRSNRVLTANSKLNSNTNSVIADVPADSAEFQPQQQEPIIPGESSSNLEFDAAKTLYLQSAVSRWALQAGANALVGLMLIVLGEELL